MQVQVDDVVRDAHDNRVVEDVAHVVAQLAVHGASVRRRLREMPGQKFPHSLAREPDDGDGRRAGGREEDGNATRAQVPCLMWWFV